MSNYLAEYCTDPFDYFQVPPSYSRKTLMFGIELELEMRDFDSEYRYEQELEDTEAYCDMMYMRDHMCGNYHGDINVGDHFVTKSDGSLDCGMEICTMPFTLEHHNSRFPWERILRIAQQNGGKSGRGTYNCGMHVNVNRAAVSALTLGKMLVLLNQDEDASLLGENLVKIFQRRESSYAKIKRKSISEGRYPETDKYERVNVKAHVVEIRAFKGNLRLDRVLKNIEFSHCVVRYCQRTGIQDLLSWENLERFIRENRKQYPNLFDYCIERNLFTQSILSTLPKAKPANVNQRNLDLCA